MKYALLVLVIFFSPAIGSAQLTPVAPTNPDTIYFPITLAGFRQFVTQGDLAAELGGVGEITPIVSVRNNDNTITVDGTNLDIRPQGTADHIPFYDPNDVNNRLGSEAALRYFRFEDALQCTNFRTQTSSGRQYFLSNNGLKIESSNAGDNFDIIRYENTITGGLQAAIGYRRFSGGDRFYFGADITGGTLINDHQMALVETQLELQVPIDMGDNKIEELADGTADSDAATVGQMNNATGVHLATTATTDGSGDITVAHSLGVAPSAVQITVEGTTFYHVQYHTKTTTNFKVRITDAAGAPVASTSVTISYLLKE